MKKKVEKMRVKNSKNNIVHSVYSSSNLGDITDYDTMCGTPLRDSPRCTPRFIETKEPVTCKTCLKALGVAQPTTKEPSQIYIAIVAGTDNACVADSLPNLLKALSDDFDGSNDPEQLATMLEEGDFSFYKAKDIDIQVEVQVTRKVISLKEY